MPKALLLAVAAEIQVVREVVEGCRAVRVTSPADIAGHALGRRWDRPMQALVPAARWNGALPFWAWSARYIWPPSITEQSFSSLSISTASSESARKKSRRCLMTHQVEPRLGPRHMFDVSSAVQGTGDHLHVRCGGRRGIGTRLRGSLRNRSRPGPCRSRYFGNFVCRSERTVIPPFLLSGSHQRKPWPPVSTVVGTRRARAR